MTTAQLPGLDLDALGPWFAAHVDGAGSDLRAELIAGGKSNLTYVVTDGAGRWVLRRPPLGHVLATAHDMGREFRVMSALAGTNVRVPRTIAFGADETLLGAPFYVMEFVDGLPYRSAAELADLGPTRTRTIAERLVQALADLGAVDPAAVGLSDFGRPAGFLGRQVERWHRQLAASRSRELPAADELHRRLAGDVPLDSRAGIVHGDFRLDNVLFDADDRPAAVIDWEMATLGDPLTDLALMIVYQRLAAMAGGAVADAACAPGYPSEAQTIERYAAATGRELPRFGWYLGLASYKLAAIVEGIGFRHARGQTVGPGFEGVGAVVPLLLATGLGSLEANG